MWVNLRIFKGLYPQRKGWLEKYTEEDDEKAFLVWESERPQNKWGRIEITESETNKQASFINKKDKQI